MARIRTVKPEFFRHKALFDLEVSTKMPLRVAFIGLWTAADREGRFRWEPDSLKLDCIPWDNWDFSKLLDQLAIGGFIIRYTNGGKDYGYIPSWNSHQVINTREMQSKIPAPDEASSSALQLPVITSNAQGELEGKGTGREKEGKRNKPLFPVGNADFDRFWSAYLKPRRKAKKAALKAWLKEKPDIEAVLSALAWQNKDSDWLKDNSQFAPLAVTYINGRRWEDEPPYKVQAPERVIPKTLGDHFKVGF